LVFYSATLLFLVQMHHMAEIVLHRESGDFGFVARDQSGHLIKMDTSEETGGQGYGVKPMQLLLMGLGGCSGIDIVTILKKQRQVIDDFTIRISGNREPGREPSLWEEVKIEFVLTGKIDSEKAERACQLSMDKYCSVAETLRKSGTRIGWEVVVRNGV
jgi:putative redox protein